MPASSWLIGQQYQPRVGSTASSGSRGHRAAEPARRGLGTVTIGGQVRWAQQHRPRPDHHAVRQQGPGGRRRHHRHAAVSINISGFTALDLTSVGGTVHPTSVIATGGAPGSASSTARRRSRRLRERHHHQCRDHRRRDRVGDVRVVLHIGTISSGRTLAVQNRGVGDGQPGRPDHPTGGTGIRLSTNHATSSVSCRDDHTQHRRQQRSTPSTVASADGVHQSETR